MTTPAAGMEITTRFTRSRKENSFSSKRFRSSGVPLGTIQPLNVPGPPFDIYPWAHFGA